MIELLFIVVAFILFLLVIVWAHFINQRKYENKVDNSFRDETNVRLYKEHKAQIERDFAQGHLDEENYQYLITELDQSLLQDIEENVAEKSASTGKRTMSIVWPVGLSIFLLVFSGVMYKQTGSYDLISNTPQKQQGHQNLDQQQQVLVQLQQLKKKTEQEPNNSDAWYSLGQALVGAGDFAGALASFDRVISIDGEHADLYGAKAQASFYQNKQTITPQVQQFIDKAMALDPRDPSTNILLGMNAFLKKDYPVAVKHWQLVISDNRPSVNVEALTGALAEAKNRMALTGEAPLAAELGAKLVLDVSVSDDIKVALLENPDKVVFVYAIPVNGSRMPLAAVKLRASDLPTRITLSDANAMTPQAKLSEVNSVNVYAIISSTGGAGIKPGDYKAEANNVEVSRVEPIQLIVDSVVK